MIKRLFVVLFLFGSCTTQKQEKTGTYQSDYEFIRSNDLMVVELNSGNERVLISPKYQAKVFTSTDSGDDGPSFGWIHYKTFGAQVDEHMNAYGGEDRLWLGPEGGRFSLFFPKGAKMEFANWKTPPPFDIESWTVVEKTHTAVELRKDMQLVNYAGTRLSLSIDRKIGLLDRGAIDSVLGLGADPSVAVVGYATANSMTNTGGKAWTDSTGMPCLWLLDMFNPSPSTTIVIPYASVAGDTSKPATTDYFGEIPSDRIKTVDGVLYFKADGHSRGKLGIHPSRAKPVAGSYDAVRQVLTIISFDVEPGGRYLNQEWDTVKASFSGDAVNAYNDGPLAGGKQMGPFYELESVSAAAFLGPGQSLVHRHAVFHFTGSEEGLDKVARKVLGVSLAQINRAFH